MGHYDCKECHQDPVSGHAPDCSRGNTLSTRLTEASVHAAEMAIMYRRGGCSLDANILRLFSEIMGQAADEIPSARITGDKDRENPVEGAPTNRWLAIEVKRLRNVLRYITELAYVDHQSGNQNYEYLQGIADSALRINAHTDHPHD